MEQNRERSRKIRRRTEKADKIGKKAEK